MHFTGLTSSSVVKYQKNLVKVIRDTFILYIYMKKTRIEANDIVKEHLQRCKSNLLVLSFLFDGCLQYGRQHHSHIQLAHQAWLLQLHHYAPAWLGARLVYLFARFAKLFLKVNTELRLWEKKWITDWNCSPLLDGKQPLLTMQGMKQITFKKYYKKMKKILKIMLL